MGIEFCLISGVLVRDVACNEKQKQHLIIITRNAVTK